MSRCRRAIVLGALALACDEGLDRDDAMERLDDTDPSVLIDHKAWDVDVHNDPFLVHQPSTIDCRRTGWSVEGEALEIETGDCNYTALVQPALAPIEAGDTVRIELFHQALRSVEPGDAHWALVVDGHLVWQSYIPIPSEPRFYAIEVEALAAAPAGAPIHFHLHNHGTNSWKLIAIEVSP